MGQRWKCPVSTMKELFLLTLAKAITKGCTVCGNLIFRTDVEADACIRVEALDQSRYSRSMDKR